MTRRTEEWVVLTINGEWYEQIMAEDSVILQIYDMPTLLFDILQGHTPHHYANIVRDILNSTFPRRWIGLREQIMN